MSQEKAKEQIKYNIEVLKLLAGALLADMTGAVGLMLTKPTGYVVFLSLGIASFIVLIAFISVTRDSIHKLLDELSN